MAGDWIKIEHALPNKPEVMEMADNLDISEWEVVGHLVCFWTWVDQNLSAVCPVARGTFRGLDRVAGRTGFAQSMVDVGWLVIDDGMVNIPNYEDHLSQSAKARALESKRKRRGRTETGQMSGSEPDTSGTKHGTEHGTREEKRREEKSNTKNPPTPLDPNMELEFLQTWNQTQGVRQNKASKFSVKRRLSFRIRIRDPSWDWMAALAKFPLKCFESEPDGWRPTVDWFLKPDSVQDILEGKYDWSKSNDRTGKRRLGPGEVYDPNHKAEL